MRFRAGGVEPVLHAAPVVAENFLRGLLAGIDFCLSPGNKPAVLKTMTTRLRIPDTASAEVGYQDLVRGVEPKPYPSLGALRNAVEVAGQSRPDTPAFRRALAVASLVFIVAVQRPAGDPGSRGLACSAPGDSGAVVAPTHQTLEPGQTS